MSSAQSLASTPTLIQSLAGSYNGEEEEEEEEEDEFDDVNRDIPIDLDGFISHVRKGKAVLGVLLLLVAGLELAHVLDRVSPLTDNHSYFLLARAEWWFDIAEIILSVSLMLVYPFV